VGRQFDDRGSDLRLISYCMPACMRACVLACARYETRQEAVGLDKIWKNERTRGPLSTSRTSLQSLHPIKRTPAQ